MTVAAAADRRPKVGYYPGLSRAEYESLDAINVSRLEHFERTPAHARESLLHPQEPTKAMDFGTALHCAVLEPMRFSRTYVGAPKVDRRTTIGKETWAAFEAEHAGSILLDMETFVAVSRMRDKVWAHARAAEMLRGAGDNEVGIVFRHEETGLLCKGLLDRIGAFEEWTWVLDVKTTQDASKREFTKSIKKYNYGAKAAFYLDGCNAVAPRPRRFGWIAIEKEPPYEVALYEADESALSAGRSKYSRWLWCYAEALKTGNWPGYDDSIQPLSANDTEWSNT